VWPGSGQWRTTEGKMMTPSLILLLGAGVCVLGLAVLVFLAIKYRNEDWVFFFWFGMIACGSAAGWCFQEAVKKAENEQRIPVDVQPGKR
jgi:hypothetical protein